MYPSILKIHALDLFLALSTLQGRKNILEEGDPDRLQYDINIVATIYGPPLIILALPVFFYYMLRLVSFI